jgi:hypothetical protein
MRPIAAALCAMLALLWVPAAAATAIINTGSYDSGFGYVFGSTGLAPGKYRFTLDFTSPAAVDFGYVEKTTVTNIFCNDPDLGVFYCGGNDVPTLYDFTPNGAGHYQTIVTVGRPRTIPVHDGFTDRYEEFETCCSYNFDFEADKRGSYTLSVGNVPEPSIWALMVLGLGAAGHAMRRRRAADGLAPQPALG